MVIAGAGVRIKWRGYDLKREVAKAAVDGEIPDADSMFTPNEASKYWLEWLKRLEGES